MSASVIISNAKSLVGDSRFINGILGGYRGFTLGRNTFNVGFPAAAVKNFQQEYTFSIPIDKKLLDSNFSISELNNIIKQKLQGLDLIVDNFTIRLHPDKKILEFEPTVEFAREMAVTPSLMSDVKLKLVTIWGPALLYGGIGASVAHVGDKLKHKLLGEDKELVTKAAILVKDEIEKRATLHELSVLTSNADVASVTEKFL